MSQVTVPVPDHEAPLDRAVFHAKRWLDAVPDRRVPATGSADDAIARLGAELPENGAPAGRGDRPAGRRRRAGPHAEPVGPLLRLGHGRHAPRRDGRRLARLGLGPERRHARLDPGRRRRRGDRGALAARAARLPADAAVGFDDGRHDGELHLPRGSAHARARASRLGRREGRAQRRPARAGARRRRVAQLGRTRPALPRPRLPRGPAERRPGPARRRGAAGRRSPAPTARRSSACRPATSTPAPSTRSPRRSPPRTSVGAWVHVDGAFGLWALVERSTRRLTAGLADCDSWATDAHKTLNTPYDGGVAIVADGRRSARRWARTPATCSSPRANPYERVPEMSRRARGVPIWAALASLGRSGAVGLVEGLVDAARGHRRRARRDPRALASSTTSSSRRSPSRSRTTSAPARSTRASSPKASSCRRRASGAGRPSSASRSATGRPVRMRWPRRSRPCERAATA